MTLAQFTISEMINSHKKAKEEYKKLAQELSENDKEVQDILHKIELDDIDLSIAFSVVLKLKCLRVSRRKIKNELAQLQTFLAMLEGSQLKKIQQRIIMQLTKKK